MPLWLILIFVFLGWSVGGLLILGIAQSIAQDEYPTGALAHADGFQFFNPEHIYKHNRLNVFGTIMLTIFYNLLSPGVALCYWFYKLCTVGRK